MASNVIKKDGTKEPFNPEKIKNSILAAAIETGLSEERKNEVIEQVVASVIQLAEGKEEIVTSEIKEKVLNELDRIESTIAEAWRAYDQENK